MDFLEKLLDKIPYDRMYHLGPPARWGIVFGVSVVVAGLYYFLVVTTQNAEIDLLQGKLDKINKEIRDNKQHAEKLDKLEARIAKLDAELEIASRQLPDSREIPSLLENISNLGTQFGLAFTKFAPRPEIRKDHYAEVPILIEVNGKFHNILMFFDEIAHLDRIVTVQDISMKRDPKNTKSQDIELKCTALTYRYIKPPLGETAAKGKPAGAKKK